MLVIFLCLCPGFRFIDCFCESINFCVTWLSKPNRRCAKKSKAGNCLRQLAHILTVNDALWFNNGFTSLLIIKLIAMAMTNNIYTCYFQNFKILASFCGFTVWFESYLVGNPENRFSPDGTHMWTAKAQVSYTSTQSCWSLHYSLT